MFTNNHEQPHPFSRGHGGFGPGFHGMNKNPSGFRAGRGMMEPAILQALDEKPMHGYEIISTIEERSHGIWRPSAGSIYPTLQLLEEKDFIVSKEHKGKKVYSLTELGKDKADEDKKLHDAVWDERIGSLKNMHAYRHELGEAMKLMRTIFRKGSDEQKDQLSTAIHSFTNRLKEITQEDI